MPLILNGKNVNKISGPVSMYILTPKKSKLFPNLPVFMLFGDIHLGEEGMCVEKENKGVYRIYDLQFLSMLSNLTRPEEPIDFYVEGGDLHNTTTTIRFKTQPMRMLWNLYGECYSKKKIAVYRHNTDCRQIKNIRWQSADPRFFGNIENFYCTSHKLLNEIFSKNVNKDDRYEYLREVLHKFRAENYTCMSNLAKESIEINNVTSETETNLFMKRIFSEYSPIYKQIKKLNQAQRQRIIEIIKNYIQVYIQKTFIFKYEGWIKQCKGAYLQLIKFINIWYRESYSGGMTSKEFFDLNLADKWDNLNTYNLYIANLNNILLDIYTICRSLKYLEYKGARPIMNILYAGNLHIKNIILFLESLLYNVQIVKSHNEDDNNPVRCVEIKDNIDLKSILDNARRLRDYSDFKVVDKLPPKISPYISAQRNNPNPTPINRSYTNRTSSKGTSSKRTSSDRSYTNRTYANRSTTKRSTPNRTSMKRTSVKRTSIKRTSTKRTSTKRTSRKRRSRPSRK
jgi:hypothetical protein